MVAEEWLAAAVVGLVFGILGGICGAALSIWQDTRQRRKIALEEAGKFSFSDWLLEESRKHKA